ncbi:hypothetical protein BH10PSE7_BH10PSE7_20620 [soil metagenome]
MSLVVKAVETLRDRDLFLQAPFTVFAGDPAWVPPLFFERKEHIDPKKNPYFAHAEAQLFVALDGDKPVGRISAQIDRLRLERYGDATGQFGFLDAVDDRAVFARLFETAEAWLRQRGMRAAQGPFSFSINEETGLLVEGFDTSPSIMMGHARPYYGAHVEALGYRKVKDVIAYEYDSRLQPIPSVMAMVAKAKTSGTLVFRPLSKKNLKRDLGIIIDIFNDAWSDNWGFVPMTRAEIEALGKNLNMLVNEEYVSIAEFRGEPAAMAVSLPNINDWLKDLNGRLLPFGWAKLAWRLFASPPRAIRIPLMGVRKSFRATALRAALAIGVVESLREYHRARGTFHGELSWILEDNAAMRHMIMAMGGTPYKTYRVYEKAL